MTDVAIVLGRATDDPSSFADVVAQRMRSEPWIVKDLLNVWFQMNARRGEDLFIYLNDTVWTMEHRTRFILQKPLESLLYHHCCRENITNHHFLRFLALASDGGSRKTIAMAFIPMVILASRMHVELTAMVVDTLIILYDATTASFFDDGDLFSCIVLVRGACTQVVELASLVVERCVDTTIFNDVVTMMNLDMRLVSAKPVALYCNFLRRLTAFSEWDVRLVNIVVNAAKRGWSPKNMLYVALGLLERTYTVRLVVHLWRYNLLQETYSVADVEIASENDVEAWKALCTKLQALTLEPTSTNSRTEVTCPITLDGCVTPVVASDGHTYERHAIIKHFSFNGMLSPMTKERVTYDLYPNRCLL